MHRLAPAVTVLLAAGAAFAAAGPPGPIAVAPPSLIAVAPRSPWTLRELEARHADLVSYDPDTGIAYVVATPDQQAALTAAGFAFATVQPDVEAGRRRMLQSRALGAYHSYAETMAELDSLAAAAPAISRVEVLGRTGEGRELRALKISDAPDENDPTEPDVLVAGNHHAREFMSVEVPLHLARTLLGRYGTDPEITRLVNEREIWIVPIVNPDGHVYQEERAASPDWTPPGWRKNRRDNLDGTVGVDLNRNYSYQWGIDEDGSSPDGADETYRGPAPFSEPETQAVRRLVERQSFVVALTYHSFGRLLLYPWGWTRDVLTDDQPLFAALADSMVRGNGYRPGNAFFGTIYKTNGEMCDYLYGELDTHKRRSTYAFTVELNTQNEGFWPDETLIAPTCAAMLPLNLFAIRSAANVRTVLPPPAPVLVAVQDAADATRVDLRWTQPADADNPVDHYEVFETGGAQVAAQAAVERTASGRSVFALGVQKPDGGRVAVRWAARLAPLWDYAYVEARGNDGVWRGLAGSATRDDSPTGRNQGRGLTGAHLPGTLWFDARAVPGPSFDLAVRLDAVTPAPAPAWVRAQLDLGATAGEVRRILDPNVHGTSYTVRADRPGLRGYGVTAVDAQGQKSDSEVYFFLIPTTGVGLGDVRFVQRENAVRLEWAGAEPGDRFTAWVWAREPGTVAAVAVPGDGARRAAGATAFAGGAGGLDFALPPGAWWVALEVVAAGEARWFGPFAAQSAAEFGLAAPANPVHDGARFGFRLPRAGTAELVVWSAAGRRVREWRIAAGAAGAHTVEWDGCDAAGRRAASGVYLVRLRQGAQTATRRIVKMN